MPSSSGQRPTAPQVPSPPPPRRSREPPTPPPLPQPGGRDASRATRRRRTGSRSAPPTLSNEIAGNGPDEGVPRERRRTELREAALGRAGIEPATLGLKIPKLRRIAIHSTGRRGTDPRFREDIVDQTVRDDATSDARAA